MWMEWESAKAVIFSPSVPAFQALQWKIFSLSRLVHHTWSRRLVGADDDDGVAATAASITNLAGRRGWKRVVLCKLYAQELLFLCLREWVDDYSQSPVFFSSSASSRLLPVSQSVCSSSLVCFVTTTELNSTLDALLVLLRLLLPCLLIATTSSLPSRSTLCFALPGRIGYWDFDTFPTAKAPCKRAVFHPLPPSYTPLLLLLLSRSLALSSSQSQSRSHLNPYP